MFPFYKNKEMILLQSVSTQRSKAKTELLKALNPIVKRLYERKKIRMVIDKKNVLLKMRI